MGNSQECESGLRTLERNGYRITVAVRVFKIGEAVFSVEGEEVDQPTVYTIQVGVDRHVLTDQGKYVNHSCRPNCCFDAESQVFRALRTIDAEDEITFDYHTTEYDMRHPFECHCGAADCRGYIRGYKHLSAEHRKRMAFRVPSYLKLMAEAEDEKL